MEKKKLTRSTTDVKILGVCAGIAAYFGWESTWVRIAWALLICLAGTGVLLYFLLAFVMPKE
jgi:phage shock protein PspC (stress-responsive transcriptional regulator)